MTVLTEQPERSPWNAALEAILEHPELTKGAHRLYLVLLRSLLGFRKQEERFGNNLLRTTGGFDGRTFERVRQELIEAELLHFEPGSRGAGHRSLYRLLLPALERSLNTAEERSIKTAEKTAEKTALVTQEIPRQSGDEVFKKDEVRTTTAATGAKTPSRLADVLEVWIRNGAYQYDENGILDEVEQRERKRGEKLDDQERARLLELAAELRTPETDRGKALVEALGPVSKDAIEAEEWQTGGNDDIPF